jgi:hypothetical protein
MGPAAAPGTGPAASATARSLAWARTSARLSRPRRVISRNSSGVKGLGRKSKAPRFMASTARLTVA